MNNISEALVGKELYDLINSGELRLSEAQAAQVRQAAATAAARYTSINTAPVRDQIQMSEPGEPGWLGLIYETVDFASIVNAASDSITFVNPIGTNNLGVVTFNPDTLRKVKMELTVQSSRKVVLNGFQTDIGNVGMLYLKQPSEPIDKFTLKITNNSGNTLTAVSFSFGFNFQPLSSLV